METRIALFQKKEVRKTLHADAWWFVIVDVVAALTDSANPAEYLKKMRLRDPALSAHFSRGGTICPPPWPMPSKGGGKLPPLALEVPTTSDPLELRRWHTDESFFEFSL